MTTVVPSTQEKIVGPNGLVTRTWYHFLHSLTALTNSNISGPDSAVKGDLVAFSDTSGLIVTDSGVAASSVVTGPTSATAGDLPKFGGSGNALLDSGIAASSVMQITTAVTTTQINGLSIASCTGLTSTQLSGLNGSGLTSLTTTQMSALKTGAINAVGTSGTAIGLLNTANTWSAVQTIPGADLNITGASGAGTAIATLTNAPIVGNPTAWIPIQWNGSTVYIPAWT